MSRLGETPHESTLLRYRVQPTVDVFLASSRWITRALIYEVSNTPWNEIHRYVIPYDQVASGEVLVRQTFHVSPFNPTTQRYVTKFSGQQTVMHQFI